MARAPTVRVLLVSFVLIAQAISANSDVKDQRPSAQQERSSRSTPTKDEKGPTGPASKATPTQLPGKVPDEIPSEKMRLDDRAFLLA